MDVAKLGSMSMASIEAHKQLERLVALGYPDVADMSEDAFRALARPLIRALERSDLGADILLVHTRELVSIRNGCLRRTDSICWARAVPTGACRASG